MITFSGISSLLKRSGVIWTSFIMTNDNERNGYQRKIVYGWIFIGSWHQKILTIFTICIHSIYNTLQGGRRKKIAIVRGWSFSICSNKQIVDHLNSEAIRNSVNFWDIITIVPDIKLWTMTSKDLKSW